MSSRILLRRSRLGSHAVGGSRRTSLLDSSTKRMRSASSSTLRRRPLPQQTQDAALTSIRLEDYQKEYHRYQQQNGINKLLPLSSSTNSPRFPSLHEDLSALLPPWLMAKIPKGFENFFPKQKEGDVETSETSTESSSSSSKAGKIASDSNSNSNSNNSSSRSPAQWSSTWDGRTRFVVYGQVFLLLVAWAMALGRLIQSKFWDRQHNIDQLNERLSDPDAHKLEKHAIKALSMSYYFAKRYVWFFPHVVGSIVWWSLYFLQLIPSVRQKHRRFHRILGRILIVCAFSQAISGAGLARTGKSSTVKVTSYLLAVAVTYCAFNAWYFAAVARDIPRHKYWSMRLVGYLQTIALQRVFHILLMLCNIFGWMGLYPVPYDEDDTETFQKIFDDSFSCCFITAMMLTEWYLAGYYGWLEIENKAPTTKDTAAGSQEKAKFL